MRPFALLVTAALAIGLAQTWPAALHPLELLPDTRFTEGQLVAVGGPASQFEWSTLTSARFGWPAGARLVPACWPGVLLGLAMPAALALNLVFVLIPAVNALGGWRLGSAMGLSPWGRATLGGLLAWSPWVHNTLSNGQIEQATTGGVAWCWGALLAGRRAEAAVAGLLVGLAAPHLGLAAGLAAVVWTRRAGPLVALAAGLCAAFAVHAAGVGPDSGVLSPRGSMGGGEVPAGGADEVPGLWTTATLGRLFLPPDPPTVASRGVAHSAYLGVVLVGAALLARRPRPLAAAALLAAGALGAFTLLLRPVAALSRTDNPYRLAAGAAVALSAGAASLAAGPLPALGLVAAAWLETGLTRTRPVPMRARSAAPEAAASALRDGEGVVLDLPLADRRCGEVAYHYAAEALVHGRPVPVVLRFERAAYGSFGGALKELDALWARPDCAERVPGWLQAHEIAAVVLHEHATCPPLPEQVACLDGALAPWKQGGETRWWTGS